MPHVLIDLKRVANGMACVADKRDLYGLLQITEAQAKVCGVKAAGRVKPDKGVEGVTLNMRNLYNFVADCHKDCEATLGPKPTTEQKLLYNNELAAHAEQHKQLAALLAMVQHYTKRVIPADKKLAEQLAKDNAKVRAMSGDEETKDKAGRVPPKTSLADSQQRVNPVPRQQPH